MQKYLVNLRVALFQLNPQIGQLEKNIERSWLLIKQFKSKLLSNSNSKSIEQESPNLIVFPEFALTGYSFHSKQQILPYASLCQESESFKFAQGVSKLFNCFTVIGYPEKTSKNILYNSALVTSPSGDLVFNYRKSFLYDTEYEWDCQENPNGFETFPMTFNNCARKIDDETDSKYVSDITLNTSIGICMDLSPYKFEAPFNNFEFATFNIEHKTDLIICPMAWLHSMSVADRDEYDEETKAKKINEIERLVVEHGLPPCGSQGDFQINLNNDDLTGKVSRDEMEARGPSIYSDLDKPDMTNINYWMLRFLPFLNLSIRDEWFQDNIIKRFLEDVNNDEYCNRTYIGASSERPWEFKDREALVLLANRCGIEDNKTIFAGSSGIYKFNGKHGYSHYERNMDSTNQSVDLLGNLGKGREGVLMRDLEFIVEK